MLGRAPVIRRQEDGLVSTMLRVIVVTVVALIAPAAASAENLYAAVRGGPGVTTDTTRFSLLGGEEIIEFKTGFAGSGALGYRFPFGLRAEAELGYLYSPLSRAGEVDVSGSIKSYLVMVNAYYDLKIPALGPFKPYVGFGLGGARVHNDHEVPFRCLVCLIGGSGEAPKLRLDEWRTAFAYQARGGMIYDVNPWLDLSLGYRYVHVGGGHVGEGPLRVDLGPIRNHSVELGFAIKF